MFFTTPVEKVGGAHELGHELRLGDIQTPDAEASSCSTTALVHDRDAIAHGQMASS
jgi:hypothetical protein